MIQTVRPIVLGFRVSKIERKFLTRAAKKRGIPLSDLIRYALRAELEASMVDRSVEAQAGE
jgi:hypothetical protein